MGSVDESAESTMSPWVRCYCITCNEVLPAARFKMEDLRKKSFRKMCQAHVNQRNQQKTLPARTAQQEAQAETNKRKRCTACRECKTVEEFTWHEWKKGGSQRTCCFCTWNERAMKQSDLYHRLICKQAPLCCNEVDTSE